MRNIDMPERPDPRPDAAPTMEIAAAAMRDWAATAPGGDRMTYADLRDWNGANALLFWTARELLTTGVVRCHFVGGEGHIIVKRTEAERNPPKKLRR